MTRTMKRKMAANGPAVLHSKKAKITDKQAIQQSTDIDDILELVASQSGSQSADVGSDTEDIAADVLSGVGSKTDKQPVDVLFSKNAAAACKQLRIKIDKLTKIVEHQQTTISSMDEKLNAMLSFLQKQCITSVSSATIRGTSSSSSTATATPSLAAGKADKAVSSKAVVQQRMAGTGERAAGASNTDRSSGRRTGRVQRASSGTGHLSADRNVNHAEDDDIGANFTLVVHRTLNDVSRRKRNVVITGLAEETDSGVSDRDNFDDFCEQFLPFKPALAYGNNSCVRIGKSKDNKPRRLLVKLCSEDAATALIEAAPTLRYCSDEYVAASVFINADLAPAAAQLAYEARLKRRENRKRRSDATTAATVAPAETMDQTLASVASPSTSQSVSVGQTDGLAAAAGVIDRSSSMGGNSFSSSSASAADAAAEPLQRCGSKKAIVNALNANASEWNSAAPTAAVPSSSDGIAVSSVVFAAAVFAAAAVTSADGAPSASAASTVTAAVPLPSCSFR